MDVRVAVVPDSDEDAGEVAEWASRLLVELSGLDDASIDVDAGGDAPAGSKGLGSAAGALLARLVSFDVLRAMLTAVHEWATRAGRTVELSIDGDVLKLTGASREQQERVIQAWLARHAPDA
ncbi:hypothetical protein GCM10009760_17820 [Kitasatospora kazusensis]|uniref:Uncharacterized protein n=1 Tax=Kitasatospora kazusensis TaxID=407974 RepID=A0ABN2Z6F2_9ACTN